MVACVAKLWLGVQMPALGWKHRPAIRRVPNVVLPVYVQLGGFGRLKVCLPNGIGQKQKRV